MRELVGGVVDWHRDCIGLRCSVHPDPVLTPSTYEGVVCALARRIKELEAQIA